MAESSTVLPPADQQRVAEVLEDDAQVMSDAQLEELLAGQPDAIQDEILSINTDARDLALQVALLVALLASLLGVVNSFRREWTTGAVHPLDPDRGSIKAAVGNSTSSG